MPPAMPVTWVHAVPVQSQVPAPGKRSPFAPKSQTARELIAVMPVKRVPVFHAPRVATFHFGCGLPVQVSTEPPREVTAQMSVGDTALAAAIQLCGPDG